MSLHTDYSFLEPNKNYNLTYTLNKTYVHKMGKPKY